jgi:hypothetical protein
MAEEYVTTANVPGAFSATYLDAQLEIANTTNLNALSVLPACRVITIPLGAGVVATVPLNVRAAAEAHTEGTPLEAIAGAISRVSITAYDLADFYAKQASAALIDYVELLLITDFTNASTSYNGTGVDLTVAGFLAAKIQLAYTNNGRGQMRAVLFGKQVEHLVTSVTAASGAIWGNSTMDASILSRGIADGYAGTFVGVPVWASSHVQTSSSDKIGAIFTEGQASADPAMAVAIQRMPYTKTAENTHEIATDLCFAMVAGVSEVVDLNRVKIISHAA